MRAILIQYQSSTSIRHDDRPHLDDLKQLAGEMRAMARKLPGHKASLDLVGPPGLEAVGSADSAYLARSAIGEVPARVVLWGHAVRVE